MDSTPNTGLQYIMAAQAQKNVTFNESMRILDAIVQIGVEDRDLATPPGSPVDGSRYIVASGAIGAWAGLTGRIAAWQDGAWEYFLPGEGWLAWVRDEDVLLVWNGVAWVDVVTAGINPTPLVGVNATADATNRLAVASPATLFNHAGAGHQQKINKAATGDTASTLYQTGFSGRAEVGLAGDDDLHVKVSADGASWLEAVQVDRSTGAVAMPFTPGTAGDNLLVNGDFRINQRAFPGGALSAGFYGHDRWKADSGGANYTVSGFVVSLASGTLMQVVESALWGFESLPSTVVTISLEGPSADMAISFGSASGTITAGSGRRSVTLTTGAGDTDNLSLKLAKASAGTVTFGRVKLEVGAKATPWVMRPLTIEVPLCQRYRWQSNFTTPGGTAIGSLAAGYCQAAGYVFQFIPLGIVMRTVPTLTLWNNGTQNQVRNSLSGAPIAITSFSGIGVSRMGLLGINSANQFPVGGTVDFDVIAEAEL